MPEINNWFEFFVSVGDFVIQIYLFVLTVKFLKYGIRFFQHSEQDREFRQWQARQGYSNSEKKENG